MNKTKPARHTAPAVRKATGAHFTPPALAKMVARELAREAIAGSTRSVDVLEPAIGDGALALALVEEFRNVGIGIVGITGYDTSKAALAAARELLSVESPQTDLHLFSSDFLAAGRSTSGATLFTGPKYDIVIANPPYVRTQVMGAAQAQSLSHAFGLKGRVDLYFAFIAAIGEALRPGGLAGLIVSNRFMSTRAGADVRRLLRREFEILRVVDLGDTKLFEAAVLPAVLVLRRKASGSSHVRARFTTVYSAKHDSTPATHASILEALDSSGTVALPSGETYLVKQGFLAEAEERDAVWQLSADSSDAWLETVKQHTVARFGDLGPIRVGIKTTADRVFINGDWSKQSPEARPELARPLVTHHIGRPFRAADVGASMVLYTHEVVDGRRRVVDLAKYPRSLEYLASHRASLESRTYVLDAGRKWFEIWVPQDPAVWERPKIVFRDIAEKPIFWLDQTGAVVNGDCYFLAPKDGVSEDLLFLALCVANSTFTLEYYDLCFNNRLYAGRRRFLTQYVEQFPLPDMSCPEAVSLVALGRSIYEDPSLLTDAMQSKIDRLVRAAFGLRGEESFG